MFFIVVVIPGHNLFNSQVSVNRTIGPTLVDMILFIFAGNEDMYKSLNEFEIQPDATTGFHGNHRVVSTQAPSFLIRSSSYLQVTRTSITSQTSSKFGQIGPMTAEQAALERMKKIP